MITRLKTFLISLWNTLFGKQKSSSEDATTSGSDPNVLERESILIELAALNVQYERLEDKRSSMGHTIRKRIKQLEARLEDTELQHEDR